MGRPIPTDTAKDRVEERHSTLGRRVEPAAADYFFESMSPDFLMARSSCQPR
jgi:hypothetical protein